MFIPKIHSPTAKGMHIQAVNRSVNVILYSMYVSNKVISYFLVSMPYACLATNTYKCNVITISCMGLVSSMSCNVFAVWRPCFGCVIIAVCHVSVYCLETMLRAGRTSSTSCNVLAVWRPCFVWVVPALSCNVFAV